MRNNPFITIFLLTGIQIVTSYIVSYSIFFTKFNNIKSTNLYFFIYVFTIPIIALLIFNFNKSIAYKKEFKYFTLFLLIVSIIIFIGGSYLSDLTKAYQH